MKASALPDSWYYSPDHGQLCQVIEAQTLWGETTCRVWLPGRDSVIRIPASRLKPLEDTGTGSPDDIAYVADAAWVADNGIVYMPTARHVWDQFLATSPVLRSILDDEASQTTFAKLQKVAEERGKAVYEELVQENESRIAREREKADYVFAARRRTIERIGLPQVCNYRLSLLAQEERAFQEQLEQKAHAYPEMVPLLVLRVEGFNQH